MIAVVVVWEPVVMPGYPVDKWLAHLEKPYRSRNFATVCSSTVEGEGPWRLVLYPWGDSAKVLSVRYGSPEKAKAQLERWVSHHWKVVRRGD